VQGITFLAEQNVRFRVAMNVTKDNLQDIESTLLLAKRLRATWFIFTLAMDFGRGKQLDLNYSPDQITYLNQLSSRLHQDHPDFFSYLEPDKIRSKVEQHHNCGAGYKSVVLGPTGDVRPCPILSKEYLTIGNLVSQSVADAFSSPIPQKLYSLASPSEQVCDGCEHSFYCRSCNTRGILTQAKRQTLCQWVTTNELQQCCSIPVNTEASLQDMACKSSCTGEIG